MCDASRVARAAAADVGTADQPLARLADIKARVERIRQDTDTLLTRVRETVAQSRDGRSRAAAQDYITQLRNDLDAALAEITGLRTAMETRGVIERAKGILMVTLRVDEDAAFQTLVRMSQASHTKVVEVARGVVEAGRDGHISQVLQ